MKLPSNTDKVIRLSTQTKRAAFVAREIRSQSLSILAVAEEAGLCWKTVANYASGWTADPRTGTTIRIFRVLGYDVVFTARESRGRVELGIAA